MTTGDAPKSIPRRNPDADALSYEQLVTRGVTLAQALSGRVWTDYNAHDPGLTLLEQLCFALTELVHRADFPIPDHLADVHGRLDADLLALPPAASAYPCRPTTADDYRRLLIDRVGQRDGGSASHGGLDDALPALAPDAIGGLWTLALRPAIDDAGADIHARLAAEARGLWLAQRNLGEDLAAEIAMVEPVDVALAAVVEIGGARDPAEIAAQIYVDCARYIANRPARRTQAEMLAAGATVEALFTGPEMRHGVIDFGDAAEADWRPRIGRLREIVAAVEGVREVLGLRLVSPGGDANGADPLDACGPGKAPRLCVPGVDATGAAPGVVLRRLGKTLDLSRADIDAFIRDQRNSRLARRGTASGSVAGLTELPPGRFRRLDAYRSVAFELPEIYGVGPRGLPAMSGSIPTTPTDAGGRPGALAPAERRAAATQLKAYLALFDQVIAHGLGRLQQARELFSVGLQGATGPNEPRLDNDALPGIEALYRAPPDDASAPVRLDAARALDRKHRALDHLLALQGESHRQNSLRQFLGHLWPAQRDQLLIENKRDYLKAILTLARDRAAGFDYSRPSWNRADNDGADGDGDDNASALTRRVGLLIGFRPQGTRSLVRAVKRRFVSLVADDDTAAAGTVVTATPAEFDATMPATAALTPDAISAEQARGYLRELLGRRRRPFALDAFARGCDPANYRIGRPLGPKLPGGATAYRVLLKGSRSWRAFGAFADPREAARAAMSLRGRLLALNDASEGLHLIEHVLLRPEGDSDEHAALWATVTPAGDAEATAAAFYSQRLTVAFPAWGVRCGDPAFRAFAAETLDCTCPAHLLPTVRWLDVDAMRRLELALALWLRSRRRWVRSLDGDRSGTSGEVARTIDRNRRAMNRDAARLIGALRAP